MVPLLRFASSESEAVVCIKKADSSRDEPAFSFSLSAMRTDLGAPSKRYSHCVFHGLSAFSLRE